MYIAIITINDRCAMGARQLSSIIRQAGHRCSLIMYGEYDTRTYTPSVGPMDPDQDILIKLLRELDPDFIGFSFRSVSEDIVISLTLAVRRNFPGKPIIYGGIGPSSNVQNLLEYTDYLCEGEADTSIVEFLNGEIPDNFYRYEQGKYIKGPTIPLLGDLDSIPMIDYTAEGKYSIVRGKLISNDARYDNELGAYPVLTSRGCPRRCAYCHNSLIQKTYQGKRYFRRRSVDHVMAELNHQKATNPDLRMLSIYDDTLTGNKNWLEIFCNRLKKEINLPFWCFSYPLFISDETVGILMRAGCNNICIGVQSLSQNTLDLYNRKTKVQDILSALDLCRKFNLNIQIDLITWNPLESDEDKRETLRQLAWMPKNTRFNSPQHKRWHLSISHLTLFPGTEMFNMIQDKHRTGGEWKPYIEDEKKEEQWDNWYRLCFESADPVKELRGVI